MSRTVCSPARAFSPRSALLVLVALSLTFLQLACSEASAPDLTPVVTRVLVEPDIHLLKVGEQVTYSARFLDARGREIDSRYAAWSSTDETVATVSYAGLVTAMAPGTASIRAVVGDIIGTVTVHVSARRIVTFEISPGQADLFEGEKRSLFAIARDSVGVLITGRAVTWTSSDPAVVTVDAVTGELTAVRSGTANVSAELEGHVATAAITVGAPPVAMVAITPSAFVLEIGEQRQLQAVVMDPLGRVLEGRNILWTTDNGSVSITQDGLVTGVQSGYVTIIATSEGVSGMVAATIIARTP
jgi:uncharacterized protein YjdB